MTVPLGTNDGGDAGGWGFVPSLYFSAPIGDRWAVGLGVGAPFGLKTEYESNWMGRFLGIKSELTTINVNPSVAFKVNDNISLGAGVNWQKVDATLTNATLIGRSDAGIDRAGSGRRHLGLERRCAVQARLGHAGRACPTGLPSTTRSTAT